MIHQLFKLGYRLHCTYQTYDSRVLKCYIRFDICENAYAFELDNEIVKMDIEGKAAANKFFKEKFADIVDLDSKELRKRTYLYYVHYRVASRGKDMVQVRTSALTKDEFIQWWHETYKFAIMNHGYELIKVEQAY